MVAQKLDLVLDVLETGAHHYLLEHLSVEHPYPGVGNNCQQQGTKADTAELGQISKSVTYL